jgi:eukaryotic-like serine/threonine-protein kinase
MDPERWKKIEDLLQSALQLPADQREAFVRQECSGDGELEQEVRSLLTSDREAKGFLQRPAIEVAARAITQAGDSKTDHPSDHLLHPLEGQIISHYRVLSKLGGGGMGVVYTAEDTRLGRRVALKFLPEVLARDPRTLQRFEREARAASSLNHPGICTIYEVEEYDRKPVIVMELLEGKSLKQKISEGTLATSELVDFGIQTADALEAAHAKGIIHRDIKPANLVVLTSGRVKILDFGLAKVLPSYLPENEVDEESLTAEGVIPGTTAYMSPEQIRGEEIDGRSDVFSLGVVLYEMAAGKRPFVGKNRVLLMDAILNATPVVPSRVNPTLPEGLDGILLKTLEKDRSTRYQRASELLADLKLLQGGSVRADAMKLPFHPVPTTRAAVTGRRLGILLSAAALVAMAISAYQVWSHRPPRLGSQKILTNKDTIVLADFSNTTGDTVFDGTLRQGLSIQLEQSPFLSIVSDQQIQQTLSLMSQKPDAKLTTEIARELCQRTGSAAVLDGSIAQIGAPYLLTLKAVNCSDGKTLASTEAQASDKNHVLDALGKTASEMRNKLGESLSTVQEFDTPLDEATTPSLEALKAFSSGRQAASPPIAISSLKHAIELDPNFAVAYTWLGIWHTSIGEPSIAAEYARKGYQLRDHASESEKYFVSVIYYKEVMGNMEKAEQTCKLWMQAYPRTEMPHTYLSGGVYPAMGRYDEVVSEASQAIRLRPDYPVPYVLLTEGYLALNRFDEANATYKKAYERKLYHYYYHSFLYRLAFLQNDAAGMKQQVTLSAGQPGVQETLIAYEADTAAYYGRLRESEDLTRRAMESAERAGGKEKAASFSATSGLREALFGKAEEARERARLALEHSSGVDVQYASALALAYAGDKGSAQSLAEELNKRFPEGTTVQFNYLPTVRAKLALNRGNPSEALEMLRTALPYELGQTTFSGEYVWNGLYPVYVRGEAYLAAHQGGEAAAEFQKILDHHGIAWNSPIGALAHLQLGRAYAMQGDTSKARAAYNDFLTLWKDADTNIPIYRAARAEYAKL